MPKVKYSTTKTLQNSRSVDLEVGKQCPKSLVAVILRFMFPLKFSMYFMVKLEDHYV